jgi:hypothetical protein
MPVTIGEVSVETAPSPPPAKGEAGPQPASADVKKEIEKTLRRHESRGRRLWAY